MWVCIGYANVGPTQALCGLLNWICDGFPTRALHWRPMWALSWYLSFSIPVKLLVFTHFILFLGVKCEFFIFFFFDHEMHLTLFLTEHIFSLLSK